MWAQRFSDWIITSRFKQIYNLPILRNGGDLGSKQLNSSCSGPLACSTDFSEFYKNEWAEPNLLINGLIDQK